jgi:ubiquinone/menaquinone biosynthesis C-methylase UbiE
MPKIKSIADPQYVNDQYHNASNLNARIRLHQQFSSNKYGWQRWLFDQIKFPFQGRVLELGCGTGNLWLDNIDRIPAGLEIILSDFSAGMVQQSQHNLRNSQSTFQFEIIDAQSIRFDEQVFDLVIANHMLYHVPDRAKALSEIQRVLKTTGRFYTSTIGKNHLKELDELIRKFDAHLAVLGELQADSFLLENGSAQLEKYLAKVSLYRYPDALMVTDASLLIDYILSGLIDLPSDRHLDLAQFVQQVLQENSGKFYITKDSGIFEAMGNEGPAITL